MHIRVMTDDGRMNIFKTNRKESVGKLKKRICRILNVSMELSRLPYKGFALSNESTLKDLGVKSMSTLHFSCQPLAPTPKQHREKQLGLDKEQQTVDSLDLPVTQAMDVDADADVGAAAGSDLKAEADCEFAFDNSCNVPQDKDIKMEC